MMATPSASVRIDSAHRYFAGERELLGCTRMLTDAGYIDKTWFTDEACLRGQFVHEAILLDMQGDLEDETLDPQLRPYVDAARAFRQDASLRVVLAEEPLADLTIGIGGKPDVVGYAFSKAVILDWKSGAAARWHNLQGEIYKHLVKVNAVLPDQLIDTYAVYLHDTGRYTLGTKSTRRDQQVAQAVITIAQDRRNA
jgi:hypothetical protein